MIYKKKISSYLITILKPFVLLFHTYQRLLFALVDLVELNIHHVLLAPILTTILLFDPKYHLDLVRYYARPYMLLSTYKYVYTIDDW